MKYTALLLTTVLVVGGCTTHELRYKPDATDENVPVSADYELEPNGLYVYVASQGSRVESVTLVGDDGSQVVAEKILRPKPGMRRQLGIASRSQVAGGSLKQSHGAGVGMSGGVADDGSPEHTVAIFNAAAAGSGPWRLRVKLTGFPEADIDLPASEE